MYMRGLSASGVMPADCKAGGGVPYIIAYQVYDSNRNGIPGTEIYGCHLPASGGGSSQPISISVPTTVQTQVSPQVSPVFVQQDSPSGSPVGAASAQQNPSSQGSSQPSTVGAPDSNFYDFLRESEERAARREESLFDLLSSREAGETVAPPVLGPATTVPVDYEPAQTVAAGPDNNLRNGIIIAAASALFVAFVNRRKSVKGR